MSQWPSIPSHEVVDLIGSDDEIETFPASIWRERDVLIVLDDSPSPSSQPAAARNPIRQHKVSRSSVPAKLEPLPSASQDNASPRGAESSIVRAESRVKILPFASSSGQRISDHVEHPLKESLQSIPSSLFDKPSSGKESPAFEAAKGGLPKEEGPISSQVVKEKNQPGVDSSVFEKEQTPTTSQLILMAVKSVLENFDTTPAGVHRATSPAPSEPDNPDTQHRPQEEQVEQIPPPTSSIGTESSLVPRHKNQHRSKSVQQRASISDDKLMDTLRGFKEAMEEDHRTTTYYKLHDAKIAIEDAPKSMFSDKVDPFASMKSVQVYGTQAPLPTGSVYEKADYWTFKAGKFAKTKTIVLSATRFDDKTPRVPGYQSYINVRRNILSADDENLKYIPYLGDNKNDKHHDKLMEELEEAGAKARDEDIQIYERAHKLRMWLTSWLKVLSLQSLDMQTLDMHILRQYVLTLPNIKKRVKKVGELRLLRTYGSYSLDPKTVEIAKSFCKAFETVFEIDIGKVVLPKEQLREMIDAALLRSVRPNKTTTSSEIPHRLATYLELTCLICGVVDCSTHGEFTDREGSDQELESSPRYHQSRQKSLKNEDEHFAQRQHSDVALTYDETLSRYRSQKRTRKEAPLKNIGPCSEECYMTAVDAVEESRNECELEKGTIDTIHDMMIAIDDPTYQSCHIAFSLSIPCWQVHIEVVHYIANSNYLENAESEPRARAKGPDWYDNKRRIIIKGDLKDMTSAHLHETRLTSDSCRHEGPCDKLCPCSTRNILCERFCGCADDCPRRFTGCPCSGNGLTCTTEYCICVAMNRECGPECGSCGALDRIDPRKKHDNVLFSTGCQNVPLQRGVAKKILMGESQLAGFGIYLVEAVRKGVFIGEYTGEVISSSEADRRGIIYDRKRMSFLFDLNASYVIDAAKMGNLTRFINHASLVEDGLNCEAKIVLVNGEHRIKFLALRDISPGQELLFNYGRKFAEKHGLKAKLPAAKKLKGVLIGEDALDALDGVTAQTKIARGQLRAGRGRRRGRGANAGRKAATKSAKPSARMVRPKAVDVDGDVDMETEDKSQETSEGKGKAIKEDEEDEEFEGVQAKGCGSESDGESESEGEDESKADFEDSRSRSRRWARRSMMN